MKYYPLSTLKLVENRTQTEDMVPVAMRVVQAENMEIARRNFERQLIQEYRDCTVPSNRRFYTYITHSILDRECDTREEAEKIIKDLRLLLAELPGVNRPADYMLREGTAEFIMKRNLYEQNGAPGYGGYKLELSKLTGSELRAVADAIDHSENNLWGWGERCKKKTFNQIIDPALSQDPYGNDFAIARICSRNYNVGVNLIKRYLLKNELMILAGSGFDKASNNEYLNMIIAIFATCVLDDGVNPYPKILPYIAPLEKTTIYNLYREHLVKIRLDMVYNAIKIVFDKYLKEDRNEEGPEQGFTLP